MSETLICGDPFTRATRGFLNKDGSCGTPLSIAMRGYLIEITPDGEGGYVIRPIKKEAPGLPLGGGPAPHVPRQRQYITIEDEEEIFLIITAFLKYAESNRLP